MTKKAESKSRTAPATRNPASSGPPKGPGDWLWIPLRNKWRNVTDKPEERVRQEFILHLHNDYGYSFEQMDQERRVMHGRRSPRADIVIWETPEAKSGNRTPVLVQPGAAGRRRREPAGRYPHGPACMALHLRLRRRAPRRAHRQDEHDHARRRPWRHPSPRRPGRHQRHLPDALRRRDDQSALRLERRQRPEGRRGRGDAHSQGRCLARRLPGTLRRSVGAEPSAHARRGRDEHSRPVRDRQGQGEPRHGDQSPGRPGRARRLPRSTAD